MSVERKPVIKKLSKGVLDLKFMKKSKEKVKQAEEDEERRNLYQDQLANLQSSADNVVLVSSHYDVMEYLPCRLSFGGVDVNIEKLNAPKLRGLYEPVKEEKVEEKEEDVTNEEMAEHFSSLNENLAKRFNPDQYKGYKRPNDKASSSTRGNRGQFQRGKRGKFQRGSRGGTYSGRGGFEQRRGGFEQRRGGFEQRREGFEQSREGFEQSRGSLEQSRGSLEQSRGRGFEHNNRGGFERGRKGVKRDSRGEYSSANEDSFRYSEGSEFENKTDNHTQLRKKDGYNNSQIGKPKRGQFKNKRMKTNSKKNYKNRDNNSSEFSNHYGKRTKFENGSEI